MHSHVDVIIYKRKYRKCDALSFVTRDFDYKIVVKRII